MVDNFCKPSNNRPEQAQDRSTLRSSSFILAAHEQQISVDLHRKHGRNLQSFGYCSPRGLKVAQRVDRSHPASRILCFCACLRAQLPSDALSYLAWAGTGLGIGQKTRKENVFRRLCPEQPGRPGPGLGLSESSVFVFCLHASCAAR